MFTGIVQGLATVRRMVKKSNALTLEIAFPSGALDGVETGASISINGVCLTVTSFGGDCAEFDVIDETLARTSLGTLREEDKVNYERAARFGSEIGGHLLSGHVSDTAVIIQREATPENCALQIRVNPEWLAYILPKGFVAVDGVSLTIGKVDDDSGVFYVHLIPETLTRTTLGFRGVGDTLNLEIDAMTQAVVHTVRRVMERD